MSRNKKPRDGELMTEGDPPSIDDIFSGKAGAGSGSDALAEDLWADRLDGRNLGPDSPYTVICDTEDVRVALGGRFSRALD